jgi:hypothetical protein
VAQAQPSRLRQRIAQLEAERDQQLKLVLEERGPLLRGSVGERRRVCGHAGCRCLTAGELHVSAYVSVAVEGTTRQTHLPADNLAEVKKKTERYRRFRQARARLVELAAEQLQLVDELGNSLLTAYPADQPVQPAGRRGPRRNKGHASR